MKSKMYTNEDQIEFEGSNWAILAGKRKERRMEKENMFKIKIYYQQMQKYRNPGNKYHQKKKYINEEKKQQRQISHS